MTTDHLDNLAALVGGRNVISTGAELEPYVTELRGRYTSKCLAVVRPGDTGQVAEVVRYCAQQSISIVPQGGNTGTVGGSVAQSHQLLLNLDRMNRVLEIDAANRTMTVQAGCVLSEVQQSALQHDCFFALSLGAQGSCQIGGNLATNAGGINVLHYGNTRDLVLGIEVVLPDGRIWNGLSRLRKDNAGYDLKHLFIGSEGTLGIITTVVLKLDPVPRSQVVALAGLDQVTDALKLLNQLKDTCHEQLTTFELMARITVKTAVEYIAGQSEPFGQQHEWYVLVVANSMSSESNLRSRLETALNGAIDMGLVKDVVIALNQNQAKRLIMLREYIISAQKHLGASIKHDVSVPLSSVPEFIQQACERIETILPGAQPFPFGHMGDGNIHFNVSQPANMDKTDFLKQRPTINQAVHEIVHRLEGSISAEHGIGISKLGDMKRFKDVVSLQLYRQIKQALDPQNLMNPGKLLP